MGQHGLIVTRQRILYCWESMQHFKAKGSGLPISGSAKINPASLLRPVFLRCERLFYDELDIVIIGVDHFENGAHIADFRRLAEIIFGVVYEGRILAAI